MRKYDLISSLFWLFFALLICVQSARLPLGSWRDPGPGFFPLGTGIVLGFLSILAYFEAYKRRSHGAKELGLSKASWKNLLLVLTALFVYAICLEILGFLLSTFFLLILLFRGIEPQRWIVSVGGSAAISFASYVVFQLWLKAQLPKGFLGF